VRRRSNLRQIADTEMSGPLLPMLLALATPFRESLGQPVSKRKRQQSRPKERNRKEYELVYYS
jgi:hypothetical protein